MTRNPSAIELDSLADIDGSTAALRISFFLYYKGPSTFTVLNYELLHVHVVDLLLIIAPAFTHVINLNKRHTMACKGRDGYIHVPQGAEIDLWG